MDTKRNLGLFLVMLLAPLLLQAEEWQPINFQWAMELAAAADAQRYPNADVVDVARKTWISYAVDGTYDEYYEIYAKVLTEKGRRDFKSITSSFVVPYNETEFHVVEVIRADGSRLNVDLKRNSRVMVEQSQMNTNIYNPNSRMLTVTIPEVKIGDTVHFIMYDRFAKVRVPDTFSDFVTFEGENPIISAEYTVVAPKSLPLRSIALKSRVEETVSQTQSSVGDTLVYRWVARDVPRTFQEPDMPPLYTQVQRLLISTVKDWQELSRWYWNLCQPAIEDDTAAMQLKVDEIIAGVDDPMQQIRLIFRWVSQEVRYLGITVEEEAPGYEPHPVSLTFNSRAGVCRDKAALLVTMLRLAGHDAYPVLMMNGPRKDDEVPQPYFNHAITAVRLKDDSYVLMDSTDENTKDLLPAYLNNQSYLVARPDGDILRTSPVEPAANNLMKISSHARLQDDGQLSVESLLDFEGINDNAYRGYFARLSEHELRGFFEKIIKRSAPAATLQAVTIDPLNMLDTAEPLSVRLVFAVPDYLVESADLATLPLLQLGDSLGMLNYILGDMGLKERQYPVLTGYTCGVYEELEVSLPKRLQGQASLPVNDPINNSTHSWQRSVELVGERLRSSSSFMLNVTEFSPAEYAELQQSLARVEAAMQQRVILDKAAQHDPVGSDAVILSDVSRFDVESDHSWSETKELQIKVLTYAGRKRFGDVHIAYNPAWDEVEILHARVAAPSGAVLEASEKEVNLMDAPWAGEAPRYPAAKIMVLSLPGVVEGSVIDLKVRRRKVKRPFFSINDDYILNDRLARQTRGHRFYLLADGVFGAEVPVLKKELQISVPAGMKLFWHEIDPEGLVESDVEILAGGAREYTFAARDIPAALREDGMAPGFSYRPVVHASSGRLSHFGPSLNEVLLKAAASDPAIDQLAGDLIGQITDDFERIRIIRDYVARDIHRLDIGIFEMPHISPAVTTLRDGYGNSCDRAVLLFALLRSAGFDPEFVLPSSLPQNGDLNRIFARVPSRLLYEDLLVRVNSQGGWIYLGDTDQYAALGSTGYDGHPGLRLRNGRLTAIKALASEYANRSETQVRIDLDASGRAIMTVERRYWGEPYAILKRRLSEQTPEERKRYYEELVSGVRMGGESLSDYETNFEGYPGVERFSIGINDFAARQDQFLALELPYMVSGIGGVGRDVRQSPLFRDETKDHRLMLTLHLADGLELTQVRPPQRSQINLPSMGYVLTTQSATGGGLKVEQIVKLNAAVIGPEAYPALVAAQRELAGQANRTVLLRVIP